MITSIEDSENYKKEKRKMLIDVEYEVNYVMNDYVLNGGYFDFEEDADAFISVKRALELNADKVQKIHYLNDNECIIENLTWHIYDKRYNEIICDCANYEEAANTLLDYYDNEGNHFKLVLE